MDTSASAALSGPEAALDQLLQQIITGFFVLTDGQGNLSKWSDPAEFLFGLAPDEALGSPLFGTLIAEPLPAEGQGWRAFLEQAEVPTVKARAELVARHPSVGNFALEAVFVPVKLDEGFDFSLFLEDLSFELPLDLMLQRMRQQHPVVVKALRTALDDTPQPWEGWRTAGTLVVFTPRVDTPWIDEAMARRDAERQAADDEATSRIQAYEAPGVQGSDIHDLDDAAAVVERLRWATERIEELEVRSRIAEGAAVEVADARKRAEAAEQAALEARAQLTEALTKADAEMVATSEAERLELVARLDRIERASEEAAEAAASYKISAERDRQRATEEQRSRAELDSRMAELERAVSLAADSGKAAEQVRAAAEAAVEEARRELAERLEKLEARRIEDSGTATVDAGAIADAEARAETARAELATRLETLEAAQREEAVALREELAELKAAAAQAVELGTEVERLREAARNAEQLKAEVAKTREDVEALRNAGPDPELLDEFRRLEQRAAEVAALREQIDGLQDQLAAAAGAGAETAALREELARVRERADEAVAARDEVARAQAEATAAQAAAGAAREAAESARAQAAALETSFEQLKATTGDVAAAGEETAAARERAAVLERGLDEIRARLDASASAGEEAAAARRQAAELQADLEDLRTRFEASASAGEEAAAARMQAVALEAAIEELRGSAGDAAAARQEAGALRIDLEKVRERAEQAAALRGDLESIRDRADAAEAVRNELRAALERIDGLTEETNRLRAHVDAEAGREHGMTADERHRLEVAHREAEEARAGLEAIRAQADELRSQAAELRDEAGQMRAGLSELREGDGHARHDLEALRREQQELRTFIEDTRRERDEAQERLTAALAEVEKARVAAELRAQHTPPPAPSGISDPSIRRRLDRSAQENAALRRDAEAVRAQLVEIAEATQAADRRAQEVRGEIASAREEIGEVREEARDAQKSAREVTERIDLIDRGAANVLAEVRAQKSAIDEAAQLAHSANEAAHEGRATAEEARAAAEEARAAAGEIRSAADEARATAHEGRAAAARAEEGLTATREQVEELRGDVAGAREAAAGAATEAAAAAEQASAAAAEAAAATDQAAHVRDDAITAAREAGSDAVNRVRDELDTMRGELDVARRDLDEVLATDSGADVREAIAALQEDVSRRLREEVDGLGVQIERLRTTQATVAKAVTADAVGALEEGLDELRTALETVRAADPSKEIGGLREELEAVRTDLARLRESDDSDAVVALQQDFKQLRTDIQAIRAKDVTDILGNLDGRLDQLRADVDTIRDSDRGPDQAVTEAVEALRADVEAVQGRLEDLPAPDVVATLRHEVAQLRGADTAGAIERFRAEVQGKLAGLTGGSADQIADLRDSIEELRNRSRVDRGLQAELSSLDLRLAALERQGTQEVNSVIERITEAVTRLDTLGVDVVAVRKDLSTGQKISDERLTSLSAELTAARTDTEQIRRSLDDLKHEMQVVREYAATAKAEGSSALQLATAAQTAGIETDRRVEELRAELADARRMMEEFRQHAQEARRSAKEAKQAAERASTADKATSERFTEVWDELINKSNSGMRSGIHKALKPMPQPEHQVRKPRKGFDDAEQPMAVIGLDGKFKELNPLFAKLIGYDEGEFQKAAWPSVHDRGLYQEQVNAFQEMIAGEREAYDVSSTYMHGQGLMVPVVGRLSVVRNEAGEPASMLLVAEDRQTA